VRFFNKHPNCQDKIPEENIIADKNSRNNLSIIRRLYAKNQCVGYNDWMYNV